MAAATRGAGAAAVGGRGREGRVPAGSLHPLLNGTGQLLIPTAFKTSSWPMLLKQVVANAFNTSGG